MAAKKCLICSYSFSGRSDAKTCSPRCRKRLQLVRQELYGESVHRSPLAVHDALSVFGSPLKTEHRKHTANSKLKTVNGLTLLLLCLFGGLGILYSALLPAKTQAATSSYLNFSARLLDSSGAVVPDGNYNIEFKIYDSINSGASSQGTCSLNSSTDDCWWIETRQNSNSQGVRVVNGYFNVNLGSVTAFGANIPWDQQLYL
ncbi:MAG TPA: hypothetical protein VFW52_02480, partial [Candidatus Saccharimonadales bacterium]|nr:hypothetical protein [Candidatus Saccharimonadales bacterium]